MNRSKLLKLIDDDRNYHVKFLQNFVQAPSPNPPGNTTEAAHIITEYLRSHEISYTVIEPQATNPNIASHFRGQSSSTGRHIVMNGHIDVFPVPDPDEWKHSPYSGTIEGNRLYGRGVVDMKAGTAASIIAYRYLYEHRSHLHGSVALTAVSDEETGGRWGTKYLLNEHSDRQVWRGDCMINAEPGGTTSVRFGEKGTLRLSFTINTVGAHGAYLHLSEGANRIGVRLISELISTIESLEPDIPTSLKEYLLRPDTQATADKIMGPGAAASLLRPTVNIGTWHSGIKVNMIPDRAVIEVDVRLPIGLTAETVMVHVHNMLQKFPDVDVAIQSAASNPSSYSPHEHPLLASILESAEQVTGSQVRAIPSLGATDCKHYRYLEIPTYVYGVSPSTMASRDENVDLDEFLNVIKVHAAAIWGYLGGDRD